jgi:hypothetical protein
MKSSSKVNAGNSALRLNLSPGTDNTFDEAFFVFCQFRDRANQPVGKLSLTGERGRSDPNLGGEWVGLPCFMPAGIGDPASWVVATFLDKKAEFA